jgi:hypothetical protein
MEHHVPKFIEHGVEGGALLQLDSRDFKILNVIADDKKMLKKNIKELKAEKKAAKEKKVKK